MQEPVTINFGNVSDGALIEAFDLKLQEVLKNIADVNTSATAKREIVLRLILKPKDDRVQIVTRLHCDAKLAPIVEVESRIFVGRDAAGNLYALSDDPRQLNIFTPAKPKEALKPLEFTR
ncbi:MAG: hypothetical protein ACYDC6_12470 [Acidobacteriaceae bacterium]